MLAVTSRLPFGPSRFPPVVLIHGAANSVPVWTYWQDMLAEAGFPNFAIDLRGHGASSAEDLSEVSMLDYADDVLNFTHTLKTAPVLIGWSMGGLVAMLASTNMNTPSHGEYCEGGHPVRAVVGLAPSTPAVRTDDDSMPLRVGEFDASEYGITSRDPDEQSAMPDLDRDERIVALSSLCRESRYARDERAAGIVLEALPCPLLIVTGTVDTQWPRSRYDALHLPAEHISIEGASHWGLVLNRRALATLVRQVCDWLIAHS